MFKKILVANRGEIAVRLLRACREAEIPSITVFSDPDRNSLHTRYADQAVSIGGVTAQESYLNIEKIIRAAKDYKADAIHPGYGFLAENAHFAEACQENELIFIGPSPKAMELMGNKTRARACMEAANVPVVPGTTEALKDLDQALNIAKKVGFPIILKAAAGGGGKGMRIVSKQEELPNAYRGAQHEAQTAFGDATIYIEKYIKNPRHIEIQILADLHGNIIHLGERECSIQRRHQKLIEESPSCIVDSELRQRMGKAATEAARIAAYTSAGTVEFLVDEQKNFYFLEMNTRLQVEHPVTEMVTGFDIVQEQFRIAAGLPLLPPLLLPLSFPQKEIGLRGHALECRITAEDPDNNFAPSVGIINKYIEPGGPGVRLDSGVTTGSEITLYYDSLIAKLITWGPDRKTSLARMRRALSEFLISGNTAGVSLKTTIPFHLNILNNENFIRGEIHTGFLSQVVLDSDQPKARLVAGILAVLAAQEQKNAIPMQKEDPKSSSDKWKIAGRIQAVSRLL